MDHDAFLDAARDFCDRLFLGLLEGATEVGYLVERTPTHVHHLDLIGDVYPDAPVVHIIRDGRDVARSLLSQEWGPADIEAAAREWRSAIEDARAAGGRISRYREVRYETLLADPGPAITGLYEWLGLSSSSGIVAAALAEAGARFNVDPAMPAVATGKWRRTWSEAQIEAFDRVAAATIAELGYDPSGEAAPATGVADRGWAGLRRRVRRLARGTRRPLQAARTPSSSSRLRFTLPAEEQQDRFDALVGHIHTGCYERIAPMLADDAEIVVVTGGERSSGRGEAGLAHLTAALETDPVHLGHQERGDVHPASAVCTGVFTYADASGHRTDVALVVHFGAEKVRRIAYYRFPLHRGGKPD